MEEFKGIIPEVIARNVSYEPQRFTMEMFNDLCKREDELYLERKRKGFKSEYILSIQDAKEQPYEFLEWLCQNFRVLCGLEAKLILDQREQEHKNNSNGKESNHKS